MTTTTPYVGQVCWTQISQPGGLVEVRALAPSVVIPGRMMAQVRHVLDHPYGSPMGSVGWYPIRDLQPCAWPEAEATP